MAIGGARYAISVVVNVISRILLLGTPVRDLYASNRREGGLERMARIRTRISVSGFNDAEITEGMADFRQYLSERPWLTESRAEWNPLENQLLVTIETEGDDPKLESEGVFDEVWDCTIAAFRFSSERIAFDILEARPVA
jgi:hypothetical protein